MSYEVIADEKQIEAAQKQFSICLKQDAKVYQRRTVGYRGGRTETDLFWRRELNFWYGYEFGWNRHWNIFGTTILNLREP